MENKIKSMKYSLENAMRITGRTKFKTALFSFGIQKNPPSVEITDEDAAMKSEYIKTEVKLDKTSIKEALKNGAELGFAQLVQSEGLRIR